MRIVPDTNILVRGAGDDQGLAGRLQEIICGPHVLVISLSQTTSICTIFSLASRWLADLGNNQSHIGGSGAVAKPTVVGSGRCGRRP